MLTDFVNGRAGIVEDMVGCCSMMLRTGLQQ
jgi:hypothetical protein